MLVPTVAGYWQLIPNPSLKRRWASYLEEGRNFISGKRRKTKQNKTTLEQPQLKQTSATMGCKEKGPSMGRHISAGAAERKCLEKA